MISRTLVEGGLRLRANGLPFGLTSLLFALLFLGNRAWGDDSSPVEGNIPRQASLSVTQFLPERYVKDGSVSYQRELQKAIDTASQGGKILVFLPITYLLDDEAGLTVHSGMTFVMYGAVFRFDEKRSKDGQAFRGHDVTDIQFLGGEVAGQRTAWADSVNIAGIRITGKSARIRIRDMFFHDLSSTGVGVFGESETSPIKDVFIVDTIVRNSCNNYTDYLEPNMGPAPGSDREDQGQIAFYYVKDFVVRGCSLEDSHSDGTHFYQCRHGQFTDNKVTGSKMGGYFVETCQDVLASSNIIRGNGSRGVTIERDSGDCTLVHNIIENSGREGLWALDTTGCLVVDNVFRKNGRKHQPDCDTEIKVEETSEYKTLTEDFRIAGNTFHTTTGQSSPIRITSGASGVVVEHNLLRGPVRTIQADALLTGDGRVLIRNNDGWKTENAGVVSLDGDAKTTIFRIPHGLDFSNPDDSRVLQHAKVLPTVTAGSRDAAGPFFASADAQHILIEFLTSPPTGHANVKLRWSVQVECLDESNLGTKP